jgi:hypothetical protein
MREFFPKTFTEISAEGSEDEILLSFIIGANNESNED